MLCTATPDMSSSTENLNSTVRVSKLSFRFYDYIVNLHDKVLQRSKSG